MMINVVLVVIILIMTMMLVVRGGGGGGCDNVSGGCSGHGESDIVGGDSGVVAMTLTMIVE